MEIRKVRIVTVVLSLLVVFVFSSVALAVTVCEIKFQPPQTEIGICVYYSSPSAGDGGDSIPEPGVPGIVMGYQTNPDGTIQNVGLKADGTVYEGPKYTGTPTLQPGESISVGGTTLGINTNNQAVNVVDVTTGKSTGQYSSVSYTTDGTTTTLGVTVPTGGGTGTYTKTTSTAGTTTSTSYSINSDGSVTATTTTTAGAITSTTFWDYY